MAGEWLKVGDFARLVGCTPANIYRYAKAYPNELGPEMVKHGRFTVISPQGQAWIRDQMYPKTLSEPAAAEQIQKLMAALSASDHKAAELQQRLSQVEGDLRQAQLDAAENQRLMLIAQEGEAAKKQELAAAQEKAEKLTGDLQAAEDKIQRLMSRGLWARLTNKEVE